MKLRRTKIAAFDIINISQGSVATHLRYGGIFNESIITNFLSWFWQWNNFENQLIFGKVKAYKMVQFLGNPV